MVLEMIYYIMMLAALTAFAMSPRGTDVVCGSGRTTRYFRHHKVLSFFSAECFRLFLLADGVSWMVLWAHVLRNPPVAQIVDVGRGARAARAAAEFLECPPGRVALRYGDMWSFSVTFPGWPIESSRNRKCSRADGKFPACLLHSDL